MPVAKPKLPEATEAPPRRDAGRGADVADPNRAMTLAEAAEMLGISEKLLTRILNQDIVPHHMVGGHPGILLRDVLAYKKVKERRSRAMDEMVRLDQEMGLYPKP